MVWENGTHAHGARQSNIGRFSEPPLVDAREIEPRKQGFKTCVVQYVIEPAKSTAGYFVANPLQLRSCYRAL